MSAILVGLNNSAAGSFPKRADTHWITENRVLWNENHHKTEECELVYEISWIPELSAWRSFLRSQQWLEAVIDLARMDPGDVQFAEFVPLPKPNVTKSATLVHA